MENLPELEALRELLDATPTKEMSNSDLAISIPATEARVATLRVIRDMLNNLARQYDLGVETAQSRLSILVSARKALTDGYESGQSESSAATAQTVRPEVLSGFPPEMILETLTRLKGIRLDELEDISNRLFNLLKRQDVETLDEVYEFSEKEWMNCRNFGEASLAELKNLLKRFTDVPLYSNEEERLGGKRRGNLASSPTVPEAGRLLWVSVRSFLENNGASTIDLETRELSYLEGLPGYQRSYLENINVWRQAKGLSPLVEEQ